MENPHPTPLSFMQEMAVDGHSFAPLPVKSSSRFPPSPTHAQRNGAACRWCDKLTLKKKCART
jgi:hypothetical protein